MKILVQCLFTLCVFLPLVDSYTLKEKRCGLLKSINCLGYELFYNGSSFSRSRGLEVMNEEQARDALQQWRTLEVFPNCWNVAKPFLCGSYLPRCSNGSVDEPCQYLCARMVSSCGPAIEFATGRSPPWLKCDEFYNSKCNQNLTVEPFNGSSCTSPFLPTSHGLNWYLGIKGCGLSCQKPFVDVEQRKALQRFIASFGVLSVLLTLATLSTFLIDWKAQSRYPAVIIFYMNTCFCMASAGWLVQFLGNTREKINCRDDGTLRTGEPVSESGYGWCLLTFFMVYSFSMSGILWFVMLAYAWHLSFRCLGSKRDKLSAKTAYFHLVAWILPVILTVIILVMEKVDAGDEYGICFVGYKDLRMRELFALGPAIISCFIGNIYLILGLRSLYRVWKNNPTFMNGKAARKIKGTMVRIAVFSFLSILFVATSVSCHLYETQRQPYLEKTERTLLRCLAKNKATNSTLPCPSAASSRVGIQQIQSFIVFGASITASSWTWTKATVRTWKRAWIRFRGFDVKTRLQLSAYRRRDKRKVVPLIRQTVPSAAIIIPASQVRRRGSLSSLGSCRAPKSLAGRMASFISDMTNDLNSSIKSKMKGHKVAAQLGGGSCTPVIIRPREGRRGTLLSIESVLTTSSNGVRIMRRGSQQWSQGSAGEYNRAFGHINPAKAQIHVVQAQAILSNPPGFTSSNLRVIRMGDDRLETYIPGMCQRNLSYESDVSNSEEMDSYVHKDEFLKNSGL